MKAQTYKSHSRYYYPHHFIFYPIVVVLFILSILGYTDHGYKIEFALLAAVFFLIGWLSFIMRQHYALSNQNRIIRLELRLRYYQLTAERLELLEEKLSFAQLAALRFASDAEFPELTHRAVEQTLSPDEIKKSIKNWLPDYMRV
jgi:hypothetical protein